MIGSTKISMVMLTLAGALALGCNEEEEAAAPPAVGAAPTEPESPAAPASFAYTETPTVADIPARPVHGNANGREIQINAVVFQPRFNSWSLALSTAELPGPTRILPGGSEAVNLTDLPQEMAVGTYTHPIDEMGGGYFQIQQPDDPERTTSWNTNLAYVLEITEWDVSEYDPEGSLFQEAGTASGKVVAVFRGSGDRFQNSWVAGTFEDAVVRYMGRPRWLEEEEEEAQ